MDVFLLCPLLVVLSLFARLHTSSTPIDPTRVTQISWHPRAFIYRGFLSDDECHHFIQLAKGRLSKSVVTDFEKGNVLSSTRTSSGMFLQPAGQQQDNVVADIETRIASWTFLPQENGEPIQVVHYEVGEKYEDHYDNFDHEETSILGSDNNNHRIATVLMYLSTVQKGGETVFPLSSKGKDIDKSYSKSCASRGYAVKPRKGDALLFFNLKPNLTRDTLSLHCSCPVIQGEKWAATKWIGVEPYYNTQ